MVKAVLLGAGRMGFDHAKHIYHSKDGQLVGVYDTLTENSERVSQSFGGIVYQDVDAAIDGAESVVIVTPTDTHADLIIKAARAGKPVFCEKPIDLRLEKIEECLEVVAECGTPLFIAFNRRFDPSFQELKGRIFEVGSIEQIVITSRDHPAPPVEYLRTSGGIFRDMTIHDFDMARWLLPEEPTSVYAQGSALVLPEIAEFGDVDTAVVTLTTKSGIQAQIINSRRAAFGYDQRIEVLGSRGMLQAENLSPTTVCFSDAKGVMRECPHPSFPQRYRAAYQQEMDHFFTEVVLQGQTPLVGGEDGKRAMLIAEAAHRSLMSGKPETIEELALA